MAMLEFVFVFFWFFDRAANQITAEAYIKENVCVLCMMLTCTLHLKAI